MTDKRSDRRQDIYIVCLVGETRESETSSVRKTNPIRIIEEDCLIWHAAGVGEVFYLVLLFDARSEKFEYECSWFVDAFCQIQKRSEGNFQKEIFFTY